MEGPSTLELIENSEDDPDSEAEPTTGEQDGNAGASTEANIQPYDHSQTQDDSQQPSFSETPKRPVRRNGRGGRD